MTRPNKIAAMENVLGEFFHRCSGAQAAGLARLFDTDSRLELPEAGIACCGSGQAEQALADYFQEEGDMQRFSYHVPHSLASRLMDSAERGQLYCETHSFKVDLRAGTVNLFCTRADADFVLRAGEWKFSKLRWYICQVFLPFLAISGVPSISPQPPLLFPKGKCIAYDHISIQNLMGAYCLSNRQNASALFCRNTKNSIHIPWLLDAARDRDRTANMALAQLAEMEAANLGYYLAIPYLGAPVIHVDGYNAEGWWMSHTYSIRSAWYGKAGREDIIRRIERFYCRFVQEHGIWRIQHLETCCLAEFPPVPFARELSGQTPLWKSGSHWPRLEIPPKNFAAQYPEDIYRVQSLFPQWGLRLRRREMCQFPKLFFIADKDDIEVDIHLRRDIGLAEIWPRLEEFDRMCRPKQTTSHNASSPYFLMNESGDRARAYWLDQSWTNMNAVFNDASDPVKFMLNCGEYCFEYIKEANSWKVAKIWWRVIFRLPDLQMDPEAPCFCNSDSQELWPLPFDTIYYES